ncbi:MAG: glycosyltransferase family 4 protein [Verrucomicrobiia bacterium]
MHPPARAPRTILMTADTLGGVWTYSLELARALQKHDTQFVLAAMGAPLSRTQRKEVNKLRNVTVFERAFKLEWMEDPWSDIAESREWLLDIERQTSPSLVHLNTFVHGALPFRAPKLVAGHSCVLSWWQAVKAAPAPPAWDRYRREVRQGLQAAALVIAPTHAMLAALDRYYGPLASTRVIPNSRDKCLFAPTPKEDFILVAGRLWDQAKNLETLLAVAPDLTWPLRLAGEWKHPSCDTVPPPHACMLGRLSPAELAHWLGRAAIYALPARYEPFGLSVVEAGLSGCALVLGDIPSLRENWDGAAVLVPPEDKRALTAALRGLIASPAQRAALVRAARERALEFTPDCMAAAYLSAFATLPDLGEDSVNSSTVARA